MRTKEVVVFFSGCLLGLSLFWIHPVRATDQSAYLVPKQQATFLSVNDLLLQVVGELQGLRKDLRSYHQPSGPVAGLQGGDQLLINRCASCHVEKFAEEKGGGIILVDGLGSLAPSRYQIRRIRKQLDSDAMPMVGDKLTAEEKQSVYQFLETLKGGGA